MNYFGTFQSINDVNYRVDFITGSGSSEEISLGAEPFVTEMESEKDTLYSPIKCTGATTQIVITDALFDLYTENPIGVKVVLTNTDTNTVEWVGFTTPCMYDMSYENEYETVEIECVDGINALKSIKYGSSAVRELSTFSQIISKCLNKLGIYRHVYVSNNIQYVSATANDSIIDCFKVSDQTFYEQKDNDTQNDIDLSMTAYDVLFEVMQFLGYSITTYGQDVYIIDYDAIRYNNNTYFRYDLTSAGLTNKTSVTLSYKHVVTGENIAPGINLSLDKVYNKVTVKDEFYTIDEDETSITNDAYITNITKPKDDRIYTDLNYSGKGREYRWVNTDYIQGTSKDGKNISVNCFVGFDSREHYIAGTIQFLSHEKFQFYRWNAIDEQGRIDVTYKYNGDLSLADMYNAHGAMLARIYTRLLTHDEYNNIASDWPAETTRYMTDDEKRKAWSKMLLTDPGTLGMSNYIIMLNHKTQHIGPGCSSKMLTSGEKNYEKTYNREDEDCRNHKFFTYTGTAPMAFGESNDAYIVIGGEILQHDNEDCPYPITGSGQDNSVLDRSPDKKFNDQFFNWCRLQIGDKYWNGTNWQSTPCDFKLYFNAQDGKTTKVEKYFDNWYSVCSPNGDIGWDVTNQGYYIPVDEVLTGTITFTAYCQRDFWGESNHDHWGGDKTYYGATTSKTKMEHNKYTRYYNRVQIWKDFKISCIMSNTILDQEDNNTDTIYTNSLENESVEELGDITFKLNTYDDKNQGFSIVYYTDSNGEDNFVNFCYNKALNTFMRNEFGSVSGDSRLRLEEMLIYRIVRQYEKPRIVYDYVLQGTNHRIWGLYTDNVIRNKSFIADTISYNYRYDESTIKLIEKA